VLNNSFPNIYKIKSSYYPNPFNSTAKITIEIETNYNDVLNLPISFDIKIFDLLGREVDAFRIESSTNKKVTSTLDWSNKKISSGLFFLVVTGKGFKSLGKLVFVK
jgi:hypothetical protein